MIIVGKDGCPLCEETIEKAKKHGIPYTYYDVNDLLSGKHEHSDDFAASMSYNDLTLSDIALPVLLEDTWYTLLCEV